MNTDNIGVKVEYWGLNRKSGKLTLRIWLFWKNKEYPLNFIGIGVSRVARRLGITEKEAKKLIAMKLTDFLVTVTDEDVRDAVEKRIALYKAEPPKWKTELRTCKLKSCMKQFYPRKHNQRFCSHACMNQYYGNL